MDDKPKGSIFSRIFSRTKEVEDEISDVLEKANEEDITEEGKKMIHSIFAFDDKLAYEIMTPRTDVFMIDIDDEPSKYLDELMKLKYSRIPVYRDDSDNIIGILLIKEYLLKCYEEKKDYVDILPLLKKPFFVPETKNIDTLFFDMQKNKQQMAMLIDEYGGFSGIVTIEDIIEEIVGDITDEFDVEEEIVDKIDENTYLVDGDVSLTDLSEEYGINLESDNSETIGGFIIDILGIIPTEEFIGKTVSFENYDFKIVSVSERRIEKVKIVIK
ncbi:MAG: hemolysin family protein [Clostridia bacterium]|nr:hemolysin family protein [Clostridia bacterium]